MLKTSALLTILATSAIAGIALNPQPSQAQNVTFICSVATDNIPTTIAQTPNGPVDVFKWQSNYFRRPYTPMQRCQEVTERMNNFKAQGNLNELTTGRVNRQPVICAGPACDPGGSNVLLTLRPEQNPNQVLQEITANRSGAAGPSRQLSGGSSSHSSGILKQNSDGTMTLNLNRYLGETSATTSPMQTPANNPSSSPIFQQNPSSAPASGGSTGRW